jgi:sugar (glycoside-pentoside-hexuronide) transporter
MKPISQKVSLAEKISYSLGDCSANLVFQMMMIYQLKFYTDVFGLEGAIAGSVLLIARIVDAFVDPTVGILSDKTQTRWGKFRPWVVWTALPFMVFYVLAFWNPGIEDKSLVAVYATVSYVLLMTMYSFNNTPYSSLGGVMSADIQERTSITSIRFVASTIAQFVVQGLTLPLVDKFGRASGSDDAHGWLCTISLFAVIGFVFLIISGTVPKERITPPAGQKMNLKSDLKGIFADVPWRAMFVLTLFVFITLAMWGSAMCFYFQNYVDQGSLYEFIRSLGLVRAEGEELGLFASILDSFGLIAYTPDKAYSIGLSLFNMIGALIQLVGVITLSEFLANRFGNGMPHAHRPVHGQLHPAGAHQHRPYLRAGHAEEPGLRPHRSVAVGDDCRCGRPHGVSHPSPCHRPLLLGRGLRVEGRTGCRRSHRRHHPEHVWIHQRIGRRPNRVVVARHPPGFECRPRHLFHDWCGGAEFLSHYQAVQ